VLDVHKLEKWVNNNNKGWYFEDIKNIKHIKNIMIFSLENIIILSWYGWAKIPPPIFFLFIMLLYLFTFTDNIPCELKFCPTYIEAQTKLVCQQVVQKNYNRAKAPEHHYVTMAKHNSNAWLCLYPSKSSVQRRQSSKQLFSVPSVNLNYCF